jgi:hypothetical protein
MRISNSSVPLLFAQDFQRTQAKDAVTGHPACSRGENRCSNQRNQGGAPLEVPLAFKLA